MSDNLFVQATRKALRFKISFPNKSGMVSTEDLWNLSLEELDVVAVELYSQLQNCPKVTFLKKPVKSDVVAQLKFDVVKYVIEVKSVEREQAEKAAELRKEKRELEELINKAEREQKASLPLDELKKRYQELCEAANQ